MGSRKAGKKEQRLRKTRPRSVACAMAQTAPATDDHHSRDRLVLCALIFLGFKAYAAVTKTSP